MFVTIGDHLDEDDADEKVGDGSLQTKWDDEVTMTRRRTMKVRILGTFRMMIRRKERDTGGRRGQRRGERGWVLCE